MHSSNGFLSSLTQVLIRSRPHSAYSVLRHTTRFHGVLSSAHAWRSRVVPSLPTAAAEPASTIASPPTAMRLARRLDWAALLRRVFGDEVT